MRGVQGRKHFTENIYFYAMEKTITFISLDHLVDMQTYAKLCGINSRGVQRRIREKQLVYTDIDGLKLIDTIAAPPLKKMPWGFKAAGQVNTEGVVLKDLISITKLSYSYGVTTNRFFKGILDGKLRAVAIAGQFFVFKNDPALIAIIKQK